LFSQIQIYDWNFGKEVAFRAEGGRQRAEGEGLR